MAARHKWEPDAGPWLVYRDEPSRHPGRTLRLYAISLRSSSVAQSDALRFDTRAEALSFGRTKWPNRVRGCRVWAKRAAQ